MGTHGTVPAVGTRDLVDSTVFMGAWVDSTYYTVKEVAALLRVSVSTVRRAVKAGELQALRVGTQGQLRVAETEIKRYTTARCSGQNGGNGAISPTTVPLPVQDELAVHAAPSEAALQVKEGKIASGVSWKIINADARRGLATLESQSINCIATSPPYYWQRDYEVDGQIGHEDSIQGYVDVLVQVFAEARRALRDDGVLFLNLGDTYYSAKGRPHGRDKKHSGRQMARKKLRAVDGPGLGLPRKSLIGIPWRVALALQADGWTLRSDIIWQRPASLPEPTAKDRPWRTYEHVFLFSKKPRYWFNRDALDGENDIWRIVARPENPGAHFAPYPRELVERCLACGCPSGGVVLDPFVGSGTTMLAALARESPAVGIDLSRDYCDFIEKRIDSELGSHSLFAG